MREVCGHGHHLTLSRRERWFLSKRRGRRSVVAMVTTSPFPEEKGDSFPNGEEEGMCVAMVTTSPFSEEWAFCSIPNRRGDDGHTYHPCSFGKGCCEMTKPHRVFAEGILESQGGLGGGSRQAREVDCDLHRGRQGRGQALPALH